MAKYKIIPSSRTIVQSPISIGHKAEKGVEAIEFDLTAWVETYGSGTLTVIMRRWGDAIPYPIALEIDENNKAVWTLSDTDTAKAGMAYAQLNYIVGDTVVKKSDIYTFRVMDSLTGEGEPPEAYESWLEHLTHLAAEAMAEVLDIESIVTDKTLTVDGGIADAKAAGDALALKADKSTTYTKAQVDGLIEDVTVETDTTLEIAGAPADAKKTGDELSALKADLGAVTTELSPVKIEATEALAFYPLTVPNGASVNVVSKNGVEYAQTWSCLFYDSTQTTVLYQFNVTSSDTDVTKTVDVDGIAYFRPNVRFSGDIFVTVFNGESLKERITINTEDISSNERQIAEVSSEIEHIKMNNVNMYDNIGELIVGRVFQGVYSSAITTVHCTDYISLVPGHTYALYGGYMDESYTNYYDKSKTYKGAMPLTVYKHTGQFQQSYNCALFTAPADCYYTRINFLNNDLDNGNLRADWYLRDVTEKTLARKNVLVIGDSISTDVYGGYKKWVTNLIENGTLSKGLTLNSSQHATGFLATYVDRQETKFIERVTALGDLSDYDIIVTFGGINDWIQHINFDDFKDAVDAYFAYLIENATQARIVVLSPMHTALYGTTNAVGKTQKDYADYIKAVAQAYSFPLLNLTDESGFCPDKSDTFRDMWTLLPEGSQNHDGVHPTAEWELKYLAPQIANFLKSII